jgi:hypothetical protein
MEILIQHNFKTGLGDMFNDMIEYMTTAKKYKEKGYKIHLVFCLYRNKYIEEKIFHRIFDENTINFFDSITETFEPIRSIKHQHFFYNCSAHDPQSPGNHRWEIFFDTEIERVPVFRIPSNPFNINSEGLVVPDFQEFLKKDANDFVKSINEKYNFIHIRTMDSEINDEKYFNLVKNLETYLEKEGGIFHLGSNNKMVTDGLKNNHQILTFPFSTFESVDNELNAYDYKQVNHEERFKRLCETISEIISIRSAKNIYSYSDYGWVSLFLLYGIIKGNKKKKDFKLISFNG